ncbi:Oidioi.mRNA.OKI2018_I69.PAR.g9339.t1.cds [Oikopleura dioica]|uniref:Oidioi.mRNA.OKI2018_I69.PAR.g9339.t1.cds n=1 Tax=Oikopleura dioica TaxID=34765 RepID=A0ABN7RPB0_OIKDI|nr:Oidioi.mRNA.OKI2018_I69.PAR.g9339.t1.cds [Oikopleura dioica]
MATLDAAFLVERDQFRSAIKEEASAGLLSRSRRRHPRRGGLCQAEKISVPYDLFIDKYVCPILHGYLGELCDGRGANCVSCSSSGADVPETWDILKCSPNKQDALSTCSKQSLETSFCENTKPKCPISFYADFENEQKSKVEDRLCCMQSINLGQELSCVANTHNTQQKKIALKLDFSPCRNPSKCIPMNRENSLRINLDLHQPQSCCAQLSWNN